MKSMTKVLIVLIIAASTSACGGGGGGAGGGGGSGDAGFSIISTAAAGSSGNAGTCTVTSVAGGVQITCADGSVATVNNGATGAQGIQGIQGVQGNVGNTGTAGTNATMYTLKSFSGTTIGTHVEPSAGSAGLFTAYDDTNNVFTQYGSATGKMIQFTLYFAAAACAGTAHLDPSVPQGMVVLNTSGGTIFEATTTTHTFTPGSFMSTTGVCTNGANGLGNGVLSQTATYSGSLLPTSFTLPAQIIKQ